MTHADGGHGIGDWCWHDAACRALPRRRPAGRSGARPPIASGCPAKDAVVRARARDLSPLDSVQPTVEQILHTAAAAKLLDALEDNLLLAPIQSSVVPLPHQLYALNRAMSRDRIRYLLADEVGLGKTIEAGLILRELKLRGMAKRILVVAPKGLVRQWQAEMRLHFSEEFQFIEPGRAGGLPPMAQRRGEPLAAARSGDLLAGLRQAAGRPARLEPGAAEHLQPGALRGSDLGVVGSGHHRRSPPPGRQHRQVARYKLGAALAEAAPYLLLLSATPHQGKTDQFHAADAAARPGRVPG